MSAHPQLKLLQVQSADLRVVKGSKLDARNHQPTEEYAECIFPVPDAPLVSRVTAANHPFEFTVANKLAFPGKEDKSSGAGDSLRRARLFRRRSARNWRPELEKSKGNCSINIRLHPSPGLHSSSSGPGEQELAGAG